MLFLDNKINNQLINNLFIILLFFIIHSVVNFYDKDAYIGIENSQDIMYFTLTTHTTCGFGDIVPKSKIAKFILMCHFIIMILLGLSLYFAIFEEFSKK